MSLVDEIKAEVDPQGWNSKNSYDDLLLKAHPLTDSRRSKKQDGILRISWSLLKSGLACPRAATWATYPDKFGIPEDAIKFTDSLASLRGNIVQTLLEHIYAHDFLSLPPEALVLAIQASWRWSLKHFHPLLTISSDELQAMRDEIAATIPIILSTINTENLWAAKRQVEEPLWWDLSSMAGVRLTGKADFILRDVDRFWLCDGKYVARPDYLDARQLIFYALILNRMTGKTPNRAFFWLYPQGKLLDYSLELTQYNFQGIIQDVEMVATQIKAQVCNPNPSKYNCKLCMHRMFCDAAKC